MDFDEIIRRRRSIRRFNEQQIRRETIIEIVNDARYSAGLGHDIGIRICEVS